jgi:hypothetical protein
MGAGSRLATLPCWVFPRGFMQVPCTRLCPTLLQCLPLTSPLFFILEHLGSFDASRAGAKYRVLCALRPLGLCWPAPRSFLCLVQGRGWLRTARPSTLVLLGKSWKRVGDQGRSISWPPSLGCLRPATSEYPCNYRVHPCGVLVLMPHRTASAKACAR